MIKIYLFKILRFLSFFQMFDLSQNTMFKRNIINDVKILNDAKLKIIKDVLNNYNFVYFEYMCSILSK